MFQLAQFNVAIAKGPTDSPVMTEFMENLDRINQLADESPGFVWRFQTEDGSATSVLAFDEPDALLNLSVWDSVESLRNYTYKSDHVGFVRRRTEWFTKHPESPGTVLWWIPAGQFPTIEASVAKMRYLSAHGPTAEAFTFARRFDPPEESG